jgi:hypothetical protein
MSTKSRIQEALDKLTTKWWLYILFLLLFFLPSYAEKSYDPRQSVNLISQVLSAPLINTFPVLMPLAKVIPAVLIVGLWVFGNKLRRAFNIYVALLYLALALLQTSAFTDTYGLVVITGNLALILIVSLFWGWEAVAEKNNFSVINHPLWKWWVAPLAVVSFLAPVDTSTMTPNFNLVSLLTNEAGLTYCMMTPVVLAVLVLYHPEANPAVLRISSFVGILFGAVNMVVWFVVESWGWWMGVLHLPLVIISVYGFVLAHGRVKSK